MKVVLFTGILTFLLCGCANREAQSRGQGSRSAAPPNGKTAPRPVERMHAAADSIQPVNGDVGSVSVRQLAALIGGSEPLTIYDANGRSVRQAVGTIPGAKLLRHYRDYPLGELPSNREEKLIFYCSSEQCGASHAAAQKAVLAGFQNVSVLPSGIMGWREAGQPVEIVK